MSWNASERRVTIILEEERVELWIGNNVARVNGQYQLIDPENPNVRPVIIPPGRTVLPLRFISESLGCQVDWNSVRQEVTVTYPAP